MQTAATRKPSAQQRLICFFLPLERPMAIPAPNGFVNPRSEDVSWLREVELPKPFNHSSFRTGKNFVAFTPYQSGGDRKVSSKPIALAQAYADGVAKNTPVGTSIEWPEDISIGFGLAFTTLKMSTILIQYEQQTDEEAIEDALVRCFESLRPFEIAYAVTSGDIAYPLTTTASSASACMFLIYDVISNTWSDPNLLSINFTDGIRYFPPDFLSDDQIGQVQQHTELSRLGLPFVSFDYWIREAKQSCWYLGRHDTATVQAFTAGEVFMDSVLLMLAWEEIAYQGSPLTAKSVASFYSFQNTHGWRVNNQFSSRLSGWDSGPSPRPHERWLDAAAKIRSKVVHTGYIPTEQEAGEVIEICLEMVDRVKSLLASDANRTQYPRCALLLLSRAGLERLGMYKGKVRRMFEEEGNGAWAEEFVQFQDDVRALIASPPPRASPGRRQASRS